MSSDIIILIKVLRIQWMMHVERMKENATLKSVIKNKPVVQEAPKRRRMKL